MSAAKDTPTPFADRAPVDIAPRIAFRPHRALPWLVLPQGLPLQVLIDAPTVGVPNTRPWFRGVASQRGNLLPVFDLAQWAGHAFEASEQTQLLAIGLGANACALRCSDAPTLLNAVEDSDSSPAEGPLAPYLSHTYASALGKAHEFDIGRWLADVASQVTAAGERAAGQR